MYVLLYMVTGCSSSDWLGVVRSLHTTGSGYTALKWQHNRCSEFILKAAVTGLWRLLHVRVVESNLLPWCPHKTSIQISYNMYILTSGKGLHIVYFLIIAQVIDDIISNDKTGIILYFFSVYKSYGKTNTNNVLVRLWILFDFPSLSVAHWFLLRI